MSSQPPSPTSSFSKPTASPLCSCKKHKLSQQPEADVTMVDDPSSTDNDHTFTEHGVGNVWEQRSAVELLCTPLVPHQIYQGEDGKIDVDNFEEFCEPPSDTEMSGHPSSPIVAISPEKYHSLFQPWRGALILKLLGKNVSLRVMEQRTRAL